MLNGQESKVEDKGLSCCVWLGDCRSARRGYFIELFSACLVGGCEYGA